MLRRQPWLLIALAAAVSTGVLLASLTGGGRSQALFGFSNNAVAQRIATPDRAAALLEHVGAQVDRVQFDWRTAEPYRAQYDWAPYDAIYAADVRRGIRPLFDFAFAPSWADDGACDQRTTNCLFPPSPNHYADAARTVAVMAKRYPRLIGIEVWNEPNTAYFWQPRPDAAAYTRLLKVLYPAVKAVAPDLPVVGGSLAAAPLGTPGSETQTRFLTQLYQAGGGGSMDVLSVHPYPQPGDLTGASAVAVVREAEAAQAAQGAPMRPLWATETGISTSGPSGVSQQQQATGLVQLYRELTSVPNVRMVLFQTLLETPAPDTSSDRGLGTVRDDMRPKIAYCSLRLLFRDAGC